MIAKTATAAVLVVVAAAPIVRMNVIVRRRKAAAADHIETVNSINTMMNRMSGTTDVTYVSH